MITRDVLFIVKYWIVMVVMRVLLCAEISGIMAGDHGLVHVVDSKRVWDSKIQESKLAGKIVSVYVRFFVKDFSFSLHMCEALPP
jgi:hypothetical protein